MVKKSGYPSDDKEAQLRDLEILQGEPEFTNIGKTPVVKEGVVATGYKDIIIKNPIGFGCVIEDPEPTTLTKEEAFKTVGGLKE